MNNILFYLKHKRLVTNKIWKGPHWFFFLSSKFHDLFFFFPFHCITKWKIDYFRILCLTICDLVCYMVKIDFSHVIFYFIIFFLTILVFCLVF